MQSVANVMFACSTQRHYHPSLFAAFAQQGVKLLADPATATQFSPRAISSIVFSYAIHTAAEDKQTCAAFIAALTERACDTLEEFDIRVTGLLSVETMLIVHLFIIIQNKSSNPSLLIVNFLLCTHCSL